MVKHPSPVVNLTKDMPKKEISKPSLAIDLEVSDHPRTSIDAQAEEKMIDSEVGRRIARRFIAITENMRFFFFAF